MKNRISDDSTTRPAKRDSRSNGATSALKPRLTRTDEKLGKAAKSGAGGYAVFSPDHHFSFRYRRGGCRRAEAERWTGGGWDGFWTDAAKRWEGNVEASLLSRPVDAIESNVPERSALNRFACLVSLPPMSDRDFYGEGKGCLAITTGGARRRRKRDLRREEKRGREFTFLRAFLAVENQYNRGAQLGRVGQRISSRFADYEGDQVPSHSDSAVRGCLWIQFRRFKPFSSRTSLLRFTTLLVFNSSDQYFFNWFRDVSSFFFFYRKPTFSLTRRATSLLITVV